MKGFDGILAIPYWEGIQGEVLCEEAVYTGELPSSYIEGMCLRTEG